MAPLEAASAPAWTTTPTWRMCRTVAALVRAEPNLNGGVLL